MAKKNRKPLLTPKDLDRAIRNASVASLRRFAKSVAETILLDHDEKTDTFVLNRDKDLDGADVIQYISEHLDAYGFWPTGD
jgi:hypothetical protein